MADLELGSIYLVRYRGKNIHDATPLILVLWPGAPRHFNTAKPMQLAHGINLSYLRGAMMDDVYKMIAMISTRRLSANNVHKLYHEYMKINIPGALRIAYRTYDPGQITGAKLVSKGFKESLGKLSKLKQLTGVQEKIEQENKIAALVRKKVQAAKNIKLIIKNKDSMTQMTAVEAEKRARLYLKQIEAIKNPDKLDPTKFTTLFGVNIRR